MENISVKDAVIIESLKDDQYNFTTALTSLGTIFYERIYNMFK